MRRPDLGRIKAAGAGNFIRNQKGAVAVEFALTVPLIILALLGSYDLARGFKAKHDLVQAASRSAELVTARDSVQPDYEFLKVEAANAARAAGSATATALVDTWLECNGTRQASMNNICPSGQSFARYVSISITDTYVPIFIGSGLFSPDGVQINGAATVRIQ